jgi:hypothetical protein
MAVGYFGRAFNKDHKSLSTKTHIAINNKVICGYKPHKTLSFQWCSMGDNLDYVECDKCKQKFILLEIKRLKKEQVK